MCVWKISLVGILVGESGILPGTVTLSRRLPWLLMLRIVLWTLPCAHCDGRQLRGKRSAVKMFAGSRVSMPQESKHGYNRDNTDAATAG